MAVTYGLIISGHFKSLYTPLKTTSMINLHISKFYFSQTHQLSTSKLMTFSRAIISLYFNFPLHRAAKCLNISLSAFKIHCRLVGIQCWPYRKLLSLDKLINHFQVSNQIRTFYVTYIHIQPWFYIIYVMCSMYYDS